MLKTNEFFKHLVNLFEPGAQLPQRKGVIARPARQGSPIPDAALRPCKVVGL